jgi:hypothetical protein
MKARFGGANTALVVGILTLIGASESYQMLISVIEPSAQMNPTDSEIMLVTNGGCAIILFASAYKSAKRRKLGLTENSTFLEVVCIAVAVALIMLQKNVGYSMYTKPFGTVLPLLWGLIALVVIYLKKPVEPVAPQSTPKLITPDQQREIINNFFTKKQEDLEKQKQDIINKAASEGKAISIEAIFKNRDRYVAEYQGSDREGFAVEIDKMEQLLREKYGDQIPIDEAYRLMKQWESQCCS